MHLQQARPENRGGLQIIDKVDDLQAFQKRLQGKATNLQMREFTRT